jgi:hypothetical protein
MIPILIEIWPKENFQRAQPLAACIKDLLNQILFSYVPYVPREVKKIIWKPINGENYS